MSLPRIELRVLDFTETGQLVELLYDDGETDSVLVCAAHGGRVEPGTAEQAIELASRLDEAACWARLGYDTAAEEFDIWHPASTAISTDDHPLLAEIAGRGFETVISFHGLADEGLIVGGGIDADTKARVRDRLNCAIAAETVTASDGKYSGTSTSNFVNWLAVGDGGLQLEQGPSTRDADAGQVVGVLQGLIEEGTL